MGLLGMDHELRARIAETAPDDRPPVLYFLRRPWWPPAYQRLPALAECPRVGDSLPDTPGGTVAAVHQWWTAYPDGGRVKVVVLEVG